MDFTDALHIATADGCEPFLTFDRKLILSVKAVGVSNVLEL